MSRKPNLRGLDGGVDIALWILFQLPHAEHALHLLHEAAVADVRVPSLVREVRVHVGVAKGLPSKGRKPSEVIVRT